MSTNTYIIKKEANIDLMRFLSMLAVVIVHIINKGGILHSLGYNNMQFFMINLFYIIEISSVNIFAMITGYLYVNKKEVKSKNIISLLLNMFFWSCLITIIFYAFNLFNVRSLGFKYIIKGILPILYNRYWYVACYLILFFSIPFINVLINHLNREELKKMIILFFILFCIVTTLFLNIDIFRLEKGFSPFWLIFCYFIGAYIKLYKNETSSIQKLITYLIIIVILTTALNFITRNIGINILHTNSLNDLFVIYNSPFLVIISYLIFLIFKNIKIKENKVLTILATNAFGVYIIHSHLYIYDFILNNRFQVLNEYNFFIIILLVILSALIIYMICIIAEEIRKFIFQKTQLNKGIEWIGKKIDTKINIKRT